MPLDAATLDHVAVAVDDLDAALARWLDLGAAEVGGGTNPVFRSHQVRLRGGAKLELIGTAGGDQPTFIDHFLQRFGSGTIHHVTVKVDPATTIHQAVDSLKDDGFVAVDVAEIWPHWHEAFLRPSTVGGLIAQVAWSDMSDADWAAPREHDGPTEPTPDAPALREVRLVHDDLAASAAVWTGLGATLDHAADGMAFTASWAASPLRIRVEAAPPAGGLRRGPVGLAVEGLAPAPQTALSPPLLAP